MRQRLYLETLIVVFVAAAPVAAQLPAGSFSGATPRPISFSAIDTTQATKVMSLSNTMRQPSQQQAFSLANVFHSLTMPSWPPVISTAPVATPSQNIFQPNQNPSLNFFPSTGAYPTTNNPYIVNKAWSW